MNARYPGSCNICGHRIRAGEEIDYSKQEGAAHWKCKQAETPIPADVKTYEIGGGSGYHCSGWTKGDVVNSSKQERERGFPEWLYVLKARSQYFREDGLSFGVGDDSGHLYHATCREATPEEAAPRIAAREAKQKAKEVEQALTAFGDRVTGLGKDLDPPWSNRITTTPPGLTVLRRWSIDKHPSYGSPFYRAVYAVQLEDGRIGYRFKDSYYDWPQDYIVIVPEFFTDEPEPWKEN